MSTSPDQLHHYAQCQIKLANDALELWLESGTPNEREDLLWNAVCAQQQALLHLVRLFDQAGALRVKAG